MENKIPQKSFDAQMHIIRDVHFDVDKYKVGEPYVINNTLVGIADTDDIKTFQGNKVIGRLVKVNKDSLIFEVPVYFKDPNTGGIYSFENITLSIDAIIDNQIEIERLMTETEAVVYLTSIIPKVCAEELIPKSIDEKPALADKYKGDLSQFVTPNSLARDEKYFHPDGTLKNIDMGEKQSTLDPKDPKFNRLLGIVPDHSQFPYTLERTHSYQELQAAYKINTPEEAAEIAKNSQMNIVNDIMKSEPVASEAESESAADTKVNKRYITFFYGITNDILINGHINVYAFHLDSYPQFYYVYLKKGETTITMRVSPSKMHFLNDRIIIGDRSCSTKMILHVDTMCDMFDEIVISDKQ